MNIREQKLHARQQEFLTVDQLALLAQYSPQTIYRKAKRGEIPGMLRFGRNSGIRFQRVVALAYFAHAATMAISE